MLAKAFCTALVEQKGIDIVSGPVVDFGVSVLTQGFPGTVKIRFDTLRALMVDLISSCVRWGFTTVIVFTWHGGGSHEIALREAALDVIASTGKETRVHVLRGVKLFDDASFAAKVRAILETPGDHADELETSLVMHLFPDLVRGDKLVAEHPSLPRFRIIPAGNEHMVHGVIGDATKATLEKGRALFTVILDELARHVSSVMQEP